jgi:hypothetical protein
MKSMIFGAALLAAAFPALAQNVSVSVGQPGFYGRIDIGGYGPPPVVYAQPIIVQPQPRYEAAPVYLRVPEGHRRHWSRWCGRYGACGQRVFFVRDDWYANTTAARAKIATTANRTGATVGNMDAAPAMTVAMTMTVAKATAMATVADTAAAIERALPPAVPAAFAPA